MSPRRIAEGSESLTQEDVKAWLHQVIDHSRKAAELRIAGAKEIAADFADNRISAEEVADRIYQYEKRCRAFGPPKEKRINRFWPNWTKPARGSWQEERTRAKLNRERVKETADYHWFAGIPRESL